MKKLLSILLVVVFAAALTVCVAASREPSTEEPARAADGAITGGWTATESPEITEEVQALFDKATDGLLGVKYVPVAHLGTQLVAGTNHCILCQATTVYPGAKPYYVLVYLYEDLRGGVEILDIVNFDIGSMISYGE